MHDLLYQHQNQLDTTDLTHHALRLGLEVYRFESALELASSASASKTTTPAASAVA